MPMGNITWVSDAGKPMSRTFLTDCQLNMRLEKWNRMCRLAFMSERMASTIRTSWEMSVAYAAPVIPSAGIRQPADPHPKIKSGSSTTFTSVDIANNLVSVCVSPCELNANMMENMMNIRIEPPAMTV